jgi:hypothetical protein
MITSDDIEFDSDVFLLKAQKAKQLTSEPIPGPEPGPKPPTPEPGGGEEETPTPEPEPAPEGKVTFTISGQIPPESWNRLGTKLIPKLRGGESLMVGVDFSVTVGSKQATTIQSDLQQALEDLGLGEQVKISREG